MALHPENWNVIVVGRWNRSILTPQRIGKMIFEMEDPQSFEVMVPLDGLSPYTVKHPQKGILVSAEAGRLQVQPEKPNYQSIAIAMDAAVKALTWLPETPVNAAGFNVNFRATETTTDIARFLQSTVDAQLATLDHQILARSLGRSLSFREGRINISFTQEGDEYRLQFNYHRDSSNIDELKQWLCIPIGDIENTTTELLTRFDLEIEEQVNDTNGE